MNKFQEHRQDDQDVQHRLAEREKELDGVYRLARLFAQGAGELTAIFTETSEILTVSMQYPQRAIAHVEVRATTESVSQFDNADSPSHTAIAKVGSEEEVVIRVCYADRSAETPALDRRERHFIETTARLLAEYLERYRVNGELERKNVALRELLHQFQGERVDVLRKLRQEYELTVAPHALRLGENSSLDESGHRAVDQILRNLERLFLQADDRLLALREVLTNREIEICSLVRNGLRTKEIAQFLKISPQTVERHRNTIRHKLRLTGTNKDLTTFLQEPVEVTR